MRVIVSRRLFSFRVSNTATIRRLRAMLSVQVSESRPLDRPLLFKRTAQTTALQPDEHTSQGDAFESLLQLAAAHCGVTFVSFAASLEGSPLQRSGVALRVVGHGRCVSPSRCSPKVYYSRDMSTLDIDTDDSWECWRPSWNKQGSSDCPCLCIPSRCPLGAIKPGEVFLAPSKYFAEGLWWDAAEDDGASGQQFGQPHSYSDTALWQTRFVLPEQVYLYSRAVPPNHAVIPELLTTKIGSDWMMATGPQWRVLFPPSLWGFADERLLKTAALLHAISAVELLDFNPVYAYNPKPGVPNLRESRSAQPHSIRALPRRLTSEFLQCPTPENPLRIAVVPSQAHPEGSVV